MTTETAAGLSKQVLTPFENLGPPNKGPCVPPDRELGGTCAHQPEPAPKPADLVFESAFWGDCCNTYEEETKHFLYAKLMGLQWQGSGQQLGNYGWNANGKRVLDIGGGPTSMLLKCINLKDHSAVYDPIKFPKWVSDRYNLRAISFEQLSGESVTDGNYDEVHIGDKVVAYGFDEVWIYNALQHCQDPEKVIANARNAAPVLRIFEWIDIPPYEGHPHMLTAEKLNRWVRSTGYVCELKGENGCWGRSWSGVFPT